MNINASNIGDNGDDGVRDHGDEENHKEVTTTVIDILSENVEFSNFLRVLQRNQLIPFLNELNNITLIAPVNSAFVTECPNLNDKHCKANMVKKFSLDDLKRYIITEPIISDDFSGVEVFKSYYKNGSPILVELDSKTSKFQINGLNIVDSDLIAESQDSVVQGIERILDEPKSLPQILQEIPNVSIFTKLTAEYYSIRNKTIFIPKDEAFHLKDYELNYLVSEYGKDDTFNLVNSLIVDGIHGGNVKNISTVDNNGYKVSLSSVDQGRYISINNSLLSIESNILTEDGIIHIYNDENIIPEVQFNPLKVIIGLNSTLFVDELMVQKLSSLITNNSIEQTIFIPTDPNQFYIASKNSNLYHFVDEKIEDLTTFKTLYNTKLCNFKKLGEQCQRIKIENSNNGQILLNDIISVQSGPYKVGETLIYLTDEDLRTPNEISSSIRSVLHCSTSLKLMQKQGLLKFSNNGEGYTVFLPCYDAWDDFELTMNYFDHNRTALDEFMKNFILNGLLYTDFTGDYIELENLNGNNVNISNSGSCDEEKLHLKYDDVDVNLFKNDDILFNQGVVHPIETAFFPSNFDISLKQIIDSSDSRLFLKFLSFFPEIDDSLNGNNYSILMPSQASLEKLGSFDSNNTLEKFLKLHIIHPSSMNDLYDCSNDVMTLLENVNLTCSKVSGHRDSFLQIVGGSDNGVRVLSRGCINSEGHNCVFAIDRPISIDWIDNHQHYHLSLPGVALAIGIMLGVVVMIFVFVCLMLFVARKKKNFISDVAQEESQADESSPLLNNQNNENSNDQQNKSISSNFENQYSNNTTINPISVSKQNKGIQRD